MRAGLAVLSIAVLAPRIASADDAASLYVQAQTLMAHGRYAEACPRLAESQRLEPLLPKLAFLAVCHEREGKLATAWREYLNVAELAHAAGLPDREAKARALAASLEPKVAKLRLIVTEPAEGESIACDGVAIAGTTVAIEPGIHEVSAKAEGRRVWSKSVRIGPEPIETEIVVPRLDAEPPQALPSPSSTPLIERAPAAEPTAAPRPARPSPAGFFIAGGTAGALGLTGIALGTGFGIDAFSKKNASDAACVGGCSTAGVAYMNQARSSAIVSTVAFGAGAVGVGVGAIVLIIAANRARRLNAGVGIGSAHLTGAW